MSLKDYHAKNDEEVNILFHPYRRRILKIYLESKEPLTVKQVSTILQERPSKVHYHVMKLLSIGVLYLEKTEMIKSIVAKYYSTKYTGFHMDTTDLSKDSIPIIKRECEKAFERISSSFSKDLKDYYDSIDSQGKQYQRMLVLRDFKLYMTETEQLEVIQMFSDVLSKYTKKDETKEVYSSLMCLTRVK